MVRKNELGTIHNPTKAQKYDDTEDLQEHNEAMEQQIELFRKIKDEKEGLQLRIKDLNAQEAYLEQIIITRMNAEGFKTVKTEYGTASISEQTFPAVKDYDKALAWIIKNKRFEFLSKTIKTAPWREAVEQGQVIPGIESYREDVLSFRRSSTKK